MRILRSRERVLLSKLLILGLMASLFSGISIAPSQAVASVTKIVNVKALDGSNYQNALVRATFYKKSDGSTGFSNLGTTDANGNASITYVDDMDYGYISIDPAIGDTTHSIGLIQNIQSLNEQNINFILKRADVRFNILNQDNSEAAIGTEFAIANFNFQTLRKGSFGIDIDSLILSWKANTIYVSPANGVTGELSNNLYFSTTKTDFGWNTKVYSDLAKTIEISPVDGVFPIKFRKYTVQITLKNSDGSTFTNTSGADIAGDVIRVDAEGNELWDQVGDSFYGPVSSGGVWQGALGVSGRYQLAFRSRNSDSLPSFLYGNLWSNGAGLVSTTSAVAGFPNPGEVLDVEARIPSTFLAINFKDRDTDALSGMGANIVKKIGSSYSGYTGFVNNLYSANGKAAISLPDGNYKFTVSSFVSADYYINVASGVYTVTDSSNVSVLPVDGKFTFYSGAPNLKMKATANGSALAGVQAIISDFDNRSENYLYGDIDGLLRSKLANGNYSVLLLPSGTESPIRAPNRYSFKVVGDVVTDFKETATGIAVNRDSNGFYLISLTEPKVTGSITLAGTSFPVGGMFVLTPYKVTNYEVKQSLNVAQPTRIPVNNSGNFGTVLEPGTYKFAINSEVDNSRIYTTSSECVVPETLVVNCPILVSTENLSLTVSAQNGDLLKGDFYVAVEQMWELSNGISTTHSPNLATGLISGRLASGNYSFTVIPYGQDTSIGVAKTFRAAVVDSVVTRMVDAVTDREILPVNGTYPLYLQKTNFRGLLKNEGVVVSGANVWGQNLDRSSENVSSSTDNAGKFSIYLGEGSNDLTVRPRGDESPIKSPQKYRVIVRNGVVSSVKDAAGTEVVEVDGFYPMGFESPNVTGSISIESVPQAGVLYAQKLDSSGKYFQGTNQFSYISSSAGYALKLDPGKYTFVIYLNNQQNLVSDICEIPVTGNVTCDTAFPTSNLKFSVSNISDVKIDSGFYVGSEFVTSSGATANSCCVYPRAGQLNQELSLLNGTYRITVNRDGTLPVTNLANTYTVTVVDGAVTKVLEGKALTPISPNSEGIYDFKFVSPGLTGTVVSFDGVTPVPNANLYINEGNSIAGYGTSASGQFAVGYLLDGAYEIWAAPSAQDITQFRSNIRSVTVLNGVVSDQIIIQLTKPNVTGTVTGPSGVASKYNWVNVRKLDSNGYYQYIEKIWGRSTNGVGKFSFLLGPGTYIFEVNGDTAVQGVRTTSTPCVVVEGVDKVCDITLASANLKFKVTNEANEGLPYSSGWYWLAEKVTDLAVRDGWMSIDGNGNGQVFLEDGKWYLRIDPPSNNSINSTTNFMVTVAGGVVTTVTDLNGAVVTAVDQIFNFRLSSGNLKGDITVGGVKTTFWNNVTVKAWNGSSYNEIMNRGFQDGSYAFKVDPGLYRVEARPNAGSDSLLSTSKSTVCEVFESGVTTCNIALQNANLLGIVKTPTGATFKEVWGYIYSVNDKDETWEQSVNLYDGKFATFLENGTYRLRVEPYWEKRSLYPSQDYDIIVSAGSVTSITNRIGSVNVIAVDGRYSFTLSAPSVTGFVYMPGDSVEKVSGVQVSVFDTTGKERWEYSTSSDSSGKFGLNLPDGSYDIVARPWGSGKNYTTSAKVRITVMSGVVAGGEITLRLRAPNFWGVIVKPDGTTPLAEVNVNVYMNGEYGYAWTRADGAFGIYFENPIITPCSNCQIYISHYNTNEYSAKNYPFTTLGDQGNLAVGGVNTRVTVLYPEAGGATSPSKWGYVAVEEFNGVNYVWQPGASTNELGKVGLSLTSGKSYKITAYPGWERAADFVAKSTLITNFDPANPSQNIFTITFATPNISFVVRDRSNQANSWGWYQVSKLNNTSSSYEYYINGYLNDQGRGSQVLAEDGSYQLTFWPGKAAGIEKTITVTVLAGVVSLNGSPLTTTTAVVLPTGNVSGRIISAANTPVAGATVAALRVDDPTKIISTVALSDGTFELGLDLNFAWDIKTLDPITGKQATLRIPIVDGRASNATLSISDITVINP